MGHLQLGVVLEWDEHSASESVSARELRKCHQVDVLDFLFYLLIVFVDANPRILIGSRVAHAWLIQY